MQVAVVDDDSRAVDVEALVAQADPAGRIEILRMPANHGLAGNWNRCIEVARGQIVHILHQDDWIADGFYDRMLPAFSARPNVGMAFCRHSLTDVNGSVTRVTHRERWRSGVLKNWIERISERYRMQCVSVLVRRSVYEQLGGYRSDLSGALDWEMWVRIAVHFAVWYEPRMLAFYRRHGDSETARLAKSGMHYRDTLKAIESFSGLLPERERAMMSSKAYAFFAARTLKEVAATAPKTQQELIEVSEIVRGAVQNVTHSTRIRRLLQERLVALDKDRTSEVA